MLCSPDPGVAHLMHLCASAHRSPQFSVPDKFFKAPANEPENSCFCTQAEGMTHPLCSTDGLLDISRCKKGAPIVLSAPHFYKGDYNLRENVLGLKPEKQKHETFLEIEPVRHPTLSQPAHPLLCSSDDRPRAQRCPQDPNQRQRQEYSRL